MGGQAVHENGIAGGECHQFAINLIGLEDFAADFFLGFEAHAGPRISVNGLEDRKSTRLNSSHLVISYAVFCLKKKNIKHEIDSVDTAALCINIITVGIDSSSFALFTMENVC